MGVHIDGLAFDVPAAVPEMGTWSVGVLAVVAVVWLKRRDLKRRLNVVSIIAVLSCGVVDGDHR